MNTNSYAYLLALGLSSVACSGDKDPPQSPGGPAEDYYPLLDGRQLVYRHSSNNGWNETLTTTQNADGTFLETDTPNPDGERSETILRKDSAGRIIRISKEQYVDDVLDFSVDYMGGNYDGFVRYDPAWVGLETGETMTIDYERTETPAGGPADETRARSHIYKSFGRETIQLSATGETFYDCLKIQRERNYTNNLGDPEDQTKLFWFAAGIGKVQEQTITGGDSSEQLIEYPEPAE